MYYDFYEDIVYCMSYARNPFWLKFGCLVSASSTFLSAAPIRSLPRFRGSPWRSRFLGPADPPMPRTRSSEAAPWVRSCVPPQNVSPQCDLLALVLAWFRPP